jgi:hypothetical protein
MKCIACGKNAKNGRPITPAVCAAYNIPKQFGVLCINCLSDIGLKGQWTGKGWHWLQAQKEAAS